MRLKGTIISFATKKGEPRRRPPYFRTKKIAIVGCTESKVHTPWFDPTWTVICHPSAKADAQREPDWWMDLHPPGNFTKGKDWAPDYYQWLKTLQTPIFMQKDWPEIPAAVAFPKQRILAEVRPYFTNHCAWMIALAMTEGVTHVGLFGCEYKHEFERGKQRGSLEYWLGRFEGAGGHVVLAPGCSLLADPKQLYGYESHDDEGRLIDAYRTPALKKAAEKFAKEAEPLSLNLMSIDPMSGLHRIPLAKGPEGEEPAWERSGHLIHA